MQQAAGSSCRRASWAAAAFMLRGFRANRVLIVVDGVRMNNAIYRAGNLQNVIGVDANAIGRAEVMRARRRDLWKRCHRRGAGLPTCFVRDSARIAACSCAAAPWPAMARRPMRCAGIFTSALGVASWHSSAACPSRASATCAWAATAPSAALHRLPGLHGEPQRPQLPQREQANTDRKRERHLHESGWGRTSGARTRCFTVRSTSRMLSGRRVSREPDQRRGDDHQFTLSGWFKWNAGSAYLRSHARCQRPLDALRWCAIQLVGAAMHLRPRSSRTRPGAELEQLRGHGQSGRDPTARARTGSFLSI
ncbi:MAG: Plug domain-containing protein [Flavobacteriales bacterium]|nr:Plug domain-containing protein [Flavobacteriales bacterium]